MFTAFAIYFIIWWITLFVVLPHGNRSQAEEGSRISGTDPGAPVEARLGRKLVINTLFAAVVYGIYWIVTRQLGFSLNDLPSLLPQHLQ